MPSLTKRLRDLFRYHELIALLVQRDLKVRYKRSAFGMAWTLLSPLLQMGVYTLVFSVIFQAGVPQFPVFLLAGLLPWTLIAVSVTGSSQCLLNNQGLIAKVAVPQMVWPLAIVASKLVDLLLSLLPLAALALLLGRPPGLSWLAVVPALLLVVLFSSGLALLFSSLTVFYRDMRHLTDILMQLWFYLTPVLFPPEFLERLDVPAARRVIQANPASPIVRVFQVAIYDGRWPDTGLLGWGALSAGSVLVLGLWVFLRHEPDHIHHF